MPRSRDRVQGRSGDVWAAMTKAKRTRVRLAAALGVTVWLGLASRRWPLPGVFAEYTGDALYAAAVYWAIALLRPSLPAHWLALAAWGVSAAVEVGQLVHLGWLDTIRGTRLGGLLFGHGFKGEDLLAYAVGAAMAFALDRLGVTQERGIADSPTGEAPGRGE